MSIDEPSVLVVHAIDTEGPLGGDARRLPDGTAEFLDNWDAILASLGELTANFDIVLGVTPELD